MKTWMVVLLILLALLAGGGYYAYTRAAQADESLPSQPSTAPVRQGDLLITVSGSGELAGEEMPLAFPISGEISELNVALGETVQSGQTLARLDDRQAELDLKAARMNWEALTAPQIVADAEQRLLELRQELEYAQDALSYVRDGPPVWYYEALLNQALEDYEEIRQEYLRALRLSSIDPKRYKPLVKQMAAKKEKAWEAVEAAQADLEWVKNYQPDPHELALAEAQAALAATRLAAQEALLDALQGAPLPAAEITFDRNEQLLALEKSKLAVDKAQWTLEQVTLAAPAAGIVKEVFVAPGERVDGNPVLTLSMAGPFQVRFYLEEADLAQVSPGDRLEITLDAYPDQVFQGSVIRIDPALVTVDGSSLVQVWGEFAAQPEVALFPGMSLEVEVIAAEASDALLIPLQALRQNPDGSYFVEVLQPDGAFKDASVTVGLKDLANAQILSGLQVGDSVSTAPR
ncbi:MAG: efflux RND transporter periplasmic adaptor subunit [Chloroflexi bacterium]|nr:efflux RND transporter periplasmic adaptor subunit [Chloroflexota bacterium]